MRVKTRLRKQAMVGGSVAVALCLAGGLAGCSSGSPSAKGGASASSGGNGTLLAAYHDTLSKQTAKVSITETVEGGGAASGSPSVAGAPSGPSSPGVSSGPGGFAATVKASGDVDFADNALDLKLSIGSASTEIREIKNELYAHVPPALNTKLPSGKSWISLDLNKLSREKLGASLSSITNTSRADPANVLGYLQAVSSSGTHKAGTTTIRGVHVTEYDATVDLDKLAAKQKTDAGRRAVKRIETQVGTSYPIAVWLDKSGLVRQLRLAIAARPAAEASWGASPPPASSGPYAVEVTATIQLYDYGTPVTVKAPPPSETLDVTGKLGATTA